VRLLFMEKDDKRYRYLCGELERCFGSLDALPAWTEGHYAEAGVAAENVLAKSGAWVIPFWRSLTAGAMSMSPWT
jgi:hypothetical protein